MKQLFEWEQVKSFEDIFVFVPRTQLASDANINYTRFGNKVINPTKFSVKDIQTMADLFNVNDEIIYSFISALTKRSK